jgi:hypothetical protein
MYDRDASRLNIAVSWGREGKKNTFILESEMGGGGYLDPCAKIN